MLSTGRLLRAVTTVVLLILFAFARTAFAEDAGSAPPAQPGPDAASPVADAGASAPTAEPSAPPAPPASEPTDTAAPSGAESAAPTTGADDVGGSEVETKIPAGKGRIRGTVVDEKTGEAMIEAQVTVIKTGKKYLTDVDGKYQINIAPGTYDLRVFAELRPARKISNVKVSLGKSTQIDVTLGAGDEKIAVQEVVVVAQPDKATEAVQVVQRQKAAVVSDSISAQQIARSPDANASDSVKRVVSATIQDGKYVVIRGLGGRYSNTLLNGVPLPSPDPDVPAAPLDLFPAALLSNLTVAKTFSPDMPGNFAGGILMIGTRDFPTKFTLNVKFSGSGDSASTFQNAYSYKGGSYDFLGYDDGSRALPSAIPSDRSLGNTASDPAAREAAREFPNNWLLRTHRLAPNLGGSVTVGNTLSFGNQKLGYLATVSYGHRWNRRLTKIQRVGGKQLDGTFVPSDEQLTEDRGQETANLGALVTLGWTPSPAHRINVTALYTHNTENSASRSVGVDNNMATVDRLRFRFLERGMLFSQLIGEHSVVPGRVLVGWQGSIAKTIQHEPDSRDLLRALNAFNGLYRIGTQPGAADRMYGDLGDVTGGGGFDFSFLLDAVKIKAGGTALISSRDYLTRRFHFNVISDRLGLSPADQAFAPENLGPDVTVEEKTEIKDGYSASRRIWAAYVMADIVKFDPFRVILGERYEVSDLELSHPNTLNLVGEGIPSTRRTEPALLPSINAVYSVSKESNIRVGYSRTVARPHFRELSPALYFDYVRRRTIGGNPTLVETSIQNVDLRWESFIGATEVIAASGFYKHFKQPIERFLDGDNVTFNNVAGAKAYGLELEGRMSLKRFAEALASTSVGANFSWIRSRIDIPDVDRPLQGQSPYVANFSIGQRIESTGTQIDALYNVFGRRIEEVGTSGNEDVYEEPFHRIDATVNQKLPASFGVKVSVTNLLNQPVRFTQSGIDILQYKPGVAVFGTLEWTWKEGKDN